MRTFYILVAVCTTSVLALPDICFAFYSVTDGLDPAKLKKDNVKIAVVKVKATRVVRPETRKQLADGSSTCMHASYSIDLELVEQLYGKKLTEADLTDVSYSNVPEDNAWALGPVDPKGRYYIMAWRLGHPCGQASGVRFSPGPDLPVLIDKPDHPSVELVKQLLAIVDSPVEPAQRKTAIAAKLKELRNALGIQVPGLDPGVPTQRGSNNSAVDKDTAAADAREDWKKHLFPVDRNGKWGFIDASGKIVIEPAFEEVAHFSEGLAAVKLNDKYGYIDQTGKTVIEPQFRYVFAFREGLAWVVGETEGFIDKTGQIVLTAPPGTYCREFREGLAKTMLRQPRFPSLDPDWKYKVGFIGKTGQYVIRPEFDAAWDFREGLAAVQLDGRWGFIDKTGRFVLRPQYERASYFAEGLAAVGKDGKTIFVDRKGKQAIAPEYEDAHGFHEDLAGVKIGGKWGFIDKQGTVRIEPGFDEVSSFFNGRASIVMDKKYGYINKRGEVVVEPRYGAGHFFLGELAGVTFHPQRGDGAGTGYVNRDGHVVWAPEPKAGD
jgi:hypothetical protein